MLDEQQQQAISNAEQQLAAAIIGSRPDLPPDVVDQAVVNMAHGSALIASAFALALIGDLEGSAEVLAAEVRSSDAQQAAAVVLTAQIAISIGIIATGAAARGGLDAALAAVHERAAVYRQIADRD